MKKFFTWFCRRIQYSFSIENWFSELVYRSEFWVYWVHWYMCVFSIATADEQGKHPTKKNFYETTNQVFLFSLNIFSTKSWVYLGVYVWEWQLLWRCVCKWMHPKKSIRQTNENMKKQNHIPKHILLFVCKLLWKGFPIHPICLCACI